MASVMGVVKAVGPIVEALTKINNLINELNGQKYTVEDSEYYRTWLDVAATAVECLEGEYEGILHQAFCSDIADAKQKTDLEQRINRYLTGEHLRKKLNDAIGYLEDGQRTLKKDAERRLLFPGTRRDRQESLAEYSRHVNDLRGYLGSLGDYTGESAVALKELRELNKALTGTQEEFHPLVESLQKSRDKSSLFLITRQTAKTISSLRAAFR